LFFAVAASAEVREAVRGAIASFPVRRPPWRWIEPGNFHLTVKFLGEVDERIVPLLHEAAAAVAARTAPFRLRFGRFGAFPSLTRPRVIFFEISEGAERLASLAAEVEEAMEALDFKRERRPFRAHLTLARIKNPLPREVCEALTRVGPLPDSAVQNVERFVLMRSELGREGARYEEIGSYRFVAPER
jgi:2'-5' RNA ligase